MIKRQRRYSGETVTLIALKWEDEEGKQDLGGLGGCLYSSWGTMLILGESRVTHSRCRSDCRTVDA